MRVLSVTHGPLARAELFEDVVRDGGHELEDWFPDQADAPPRPVGEYEAALVFGGGQNVGEEREHPWLETEYEVLRELVERRVPLLGVCLGAQLVAHVLGAEVALSPEPERGFVPVQATDAARDDPVFSWLPDRFDAFEAHRYAFELPAGAVELARSRVCVQAFRAGECTWGVQFHPEVRLWQVERWFGDEERRLPNAEALLAEARERIGEWNTFGSRLCGAFLAAAERLAAVR